MVRLKNYSQGSQSNQTIMPTDSLFFYFLSHTQWCSNLEKFGAYSLGLCLGVTPIEAREPYWLLEIKPRLAAWKASKYLFCNTISLDPDYICVSFDTGIFIQVLFIK